MSFIAPLTAAPALLAAADTDWPAWATVVVIIGASLLVLFGFVVETRDRRRRAEAADEE